MRLGEPIGDWTLLEEIGRGGNGVVYRARHRNLDREFALKVLKADVAADDPANRRLAREAMALSALRHPNIVDSLPPVVLAGRFGFPMELLEGCSLSEARRRLDTPWPEAEAVEIVRQAATGVGFAHGQGILHRDLKPGNIFLVPDGATFAVKVLDFGLAKIAGHESLTSPGVFVGTPSYAAPEVMAGERASPASDVHGLGLVLYVLLAGRLPYSLPEAGSLWATLSAIMTAYEQGLPPVTAFAPVSGLVAELVGRCIDADPPCRPPDGAALAAALTRVAAPTRGSGDFAATVFARTASSYDERGPPALGLDLPDVFARTGAPRTARLDARPDVRLDAHPDVRLDAHPDVRLDAHPDVRLDAHPDVRLDAHPDVRLDAHPDVRLDAAGPAPSWVVCPRCALRHSKRSDGVCPRCGAGVDAGVEDRGRAAAPPRRPAEEGRRRALFGLAAAFVVSVGLVVASAAGLVTFAGRDGRSPWGPRGGGRYDGRIESAPPAAGLATDGGTRERASPPPFASRPPFVRPPPAKPRPPPTNPGSRWPSFFTPSVPVRLEAQREPHLVLGGILTAQRSFRASMDFFASCGADGPGGQKKEFWSLRRCPSACGRQNPEACDSFDCIGFRPEGRTYFRYACQSTLPGRGQPSDVTCAAVADLDGDGRPKMFVVGTASQYTSTRISAPIPDLGDPGICAPGVTPAGEIVDCHPGEW